MQGKKQVIVYNKVEDRTPKQEERVLISIPLKGNEVKFEDDKKVNEIEKNSKENDVLFNLQSCTIKEDNKAGITFTTLSEKEQIGDDGKIKKMSKIPSV